AWVAPCWFCASLAGRAMQGKMAIMKIRIIRIYNTGRAWYPDKQNRRFPMIALLKTATYSVMHICVATTLAYIISGSWAVAVSIGLLEPMVQTVFFYMHERVWERVKQRVGARLSGASYTSYTEV